MRVCAAVIINAGQFLICSRPPGSNNEHKWEFPGGKVDLGETDAECLRREIHEELFMDVIVLDKLYVSFFVHQGKLSELHFYRCIQKNTLQNPTPRENQATAWVNPSDFKSYDFLPADLEFIDILKKSYF